MLALIYSFNRWYDRLDDHHGVLRLMLCLIILMSLSIMTNWSGAIWINITGLVGLIVLAVLRITPLVIPSKQL